MAMSRKEREDFLRGVHVGVLSIADGDRGPMAVPIWYDYEPGGLVWLVTSRQSRKGKLLELAKRFSLCAQTEEMPYKYVSVEGPITSIEPADSEIHFRPMAHRYLGKVEGDAYAESMKGTPEAEDSILVRMKPERWLSVDYSKA